MRQMVLIVRSPKSCFGCNNDFHIFFTEFILNFLETDIKANELNCVFGMSYIEKDDLQLFLTRKNNYNAYKNNYSDYK